MRDLVSERLRALYKPQNNPLSHVQNKYLVYAYIIALISRIFVHWLDRELDT